MAMSIRASLQSVIGLRQDCNLQLSFPTPLTRAEYRMGQGNLVLVPPGRDVKEGLLSSDSRSLHSGEGFQTEFDEERRRAALSARGAAPQHRLAVGQTAPPCARAMGTHCARSALAGPFGVSRPSRTASHGEHVRMPLRAMAHALRHGVCRVGTAPTRETVPSAPSGRPPRRRSAQLGDVSCQLVPSQPLCQYMCLIYKRPPEEL